MNPHIEQALQCLKRANIAGYFKELDKVEIPAQYEYLYATNKGIFISGQPLPYDFNRKLEVLAGEIDKASGNDATVQASTNEKHLPAEEVATISLDDFKKQMLALVDEGEFGQVYDAIKKSPYTYQKFLLNRSEQEMAFGASLALVNSLKVFIGSLKEPK